jgi:hypothetical protein
LPSWAPADAILALVHVRSGAYNEARAHTLKVLNHFKTDPVDTSVVASLYSLWTTGFELAKEPATRDLAETALELAVASPFALNSVRLSLDDGPIGRLIDLYLHAGRRADARKTLLNIVRSDKTPPSYDPSAIRQMRMAGLPSIGRELVKLGYGADAVPIFQEALALAEMPTQLVGNLRLLTDPFDPAAVREDLDRAMNEMDRADLAAVAGRAVAGAIEDVQTEGTTQQVGESARAVARDQAIDLVTLVYPRDLDMATVRSLVAESPAVCDAAQLAALDEPLETLRKSHPADLSVAVVVALQSLATNDPRRIEPAVARLSDLVEKSPLERLPASTRANARQRTEAARLIPLWLVARACRRQTSAAIREAGNRFAARAIEAAGRQNDSRWTLAMLREQGQVALDHHDHAQAEAAWSRMLNMVLTPAPVRIQRPGAARTGHVGARATPPARPSSRVDRSAD